MDAQGPGRVARFPVFDRFTKASRDALGLAADEARGLGHNRIGTEHLLLGLVRLGDPATAHLGLSLTGTREGVRRVVGSGGGRRTIGELRFTDTAKRVLQRANESAGDREAGPGDLLASLLGDEESGAAGLLGTGNGGGRRARATGGDDGGLLFGLGQRARSVTAGPLAYLGVDADRLGRAVTFVRQD